MSVRAERVPWARRIAVRLRRDVPLALIDLAIVLPAYLMPLVLRFDGAVPDAFWDSFWAFIPVAALIHLLSNYLFGLYGQMWRYASVQEARRVVLAGLTATAVVVLADLWLDRGLTPIPLSVAVMGGTLSFIGFGGVRFQSRLFGFRRRTVPEHRTRILIVGAGDAGSLVLKDIRANPSLSLDPVGVVDDDRRKLGLSLHGVQVLGTRAMLPSLVQELGVEQVLLAIPSATSSVVRDVAALCEEAHVTLRVLPSVREIVGGRITARDIRDLRIEDLLGRQQVETDPAAVRELLEGKRVLITGAGGSIGSEIVRQAMAFEPATLVLVDHDETHLHDILSELPADARVEGVLADIRERERMHALFGEHRPQVVFHAAAHKHVPLLETHPDEAVLTNVLGTANVVDAAVASRVRRFVLISTDKAVQPASVMGSTKWFAEQIVRSVHETGCVFSAVRFGNVVGSRGSVIPTFLKQISQGGPVTVTDPSMARYFMSIQEAVQLVLYAAALSRGGEVLTLDMGEPVNILDLARKLIRLSGRVPGKDVEISIVGVRPGEKLVEDLVHPEEEPLPSGHPGISISRPQVPDRPALRRALRELEGLVHAGNAAALADGMKRMAAGSLVESTPVAGAR
ncbi:MAG TPA: nucleoside-diphosphate sugar epimerase/dehydratase [Actinomycetota bacterium]